MLFQVAGLAKILETVIPSLILLIIAVYFCAFFSKNYFRTKYKMFKYLSLFYLTYILSIIPMIISSFFLKDLEMTKILFILSTIFDVLVLYSIIVLLEVFERDAQFSKRQIFLTIITFLIIGGLLSNPPLNISVNDGNYSVEITDDSFIGIAVSFFSLSSFILLFSMLHRSRKTAWSSTQRSIIKLLFLGIFISFLFPTILYIFNFSFHPRSIPSQIVHLGSYIIQNIGMIIIGFTFFKASKRPWLLQRQRIHMLLVYSESGIQLYSKIFGDQISLNDTELLTGAFSAISNLFKEATKTTGNIDTIILEGRELKIIKKDHFLCALLVDYTTQASNMAHKNFTQDFETTFSKQLENFVGEVSEFQKADSIARHYFFE